MMLFLRRFIVIVIIIIVTYIVCIIVQEHTTGRYVGGQDLRVWLRHFFFVCVCLRNNGIYTSGPFFYQQIIYRGILYNCVRKSSYRHFIITTDWGIHHTKLASYLLDQGSCPELRHWKWYSRFCSTVSQ